MSKEEVSPATCRGLKLNSKCQTCGNREKVNRCERHKSWFVSNALNLGMEIVCCHSCLTFSHNHIFVVCRVKGKG